MGTTAIDAAVATRSPRTAGLRSWPAFLVRGVWRILILPALIIGGPIPAALLLTHANERGFFDFKGGLWQAGVAILHGADPYRAAYLAHQAAVMHAGGIAVGESVNHVFSVPLYPAFANVAVIPLSLLPYWWAAAVYTVLSCVAMWLALRLLGVRDWRCHAAWLISMPFLWGAALGAIGPFLVLGIAAMWRWRDRVVTPALALAAIVALKIFPWTLGVWLLSTRRYAAAALAVVAGFVLTFGAWALIGFHGLAQYPQMLSNATYIQEGRADSVATVALVFGASARLAQAIALLAGVALLTLAWRLRGRPDGDRTAFGLAIIACLLATPIVWAHYMILLFVPIALLSPRFSRLWLGPLITPTLITFSYAVIPLSHRIQPAAPDALNPALGYLALEAWLAVRLCTTREQRAAVLTAARARLPRRPRSTIALTID
jgi:hypothetical protein